ncbi:MAG: Gfo/Idh/MocA family protein [Armatimonadota bacterium]
MQTLGIGMIGYGFMGKMHTYSYLSLPMLYDPAPAKIRLIGICTASEESGQKAMEQAGYQFATQDYHDLIERDDIQVINVCTPNFLHKEQIIAALEAGKHVYCDKPLAMDLDEARHIWEVAKKSKTIHQMTFQYRFIPAILKARMLIEAGFLGRVYQFRVLYLHSGYIEPNRPMSWRLDKSRGGAGAAYDLGSHIIDLTRYLLGDFEQVLATTETFVKKRPVSPGSAEFVPVEVDDVFWSQVRLKSGAVGVMEASRMSTGAMDEIRFEAHGDKGAIRFNSMDPNWLEVYDATLPSGDYGGDRGFKRIECVQHYPKPAALPGPRFSIGWMRYHIASIHDFVTNVVNQNQSRPSIEDGLKVHEVLDACFRSVATGQWVMVEEH